MMESKVPERVETTAVAEQEETRPSERDLLIRIVKLQMQLNSKLFEFMREYQARSNFGEHGIFRDGNGQKSRIARLMDEVNELGVALSQVSSVFTGEQLFEKRDKAGRVLVSCRHCGKETPFAHVVDSPYGLADAYLFGSERLVCVVCRKDTLYPGDERLPKFSSVFRLD